eukprot:5659014-Amphidinium_carterae.1
MPLPIHEAMTQKQSFNGKIYNSEDHVLPFGVPSSLPHPLELTPLLNGRDGDNGIENRSKWQAIGVYSSDQLGA